MALRIQARAERRAGELLKQVEAKHTGRPKKNGAVVGPISRKGAAKAAGLSERQAKTALRVASVPEGEFKEQVECPVALLACVKFRGESTFGLTMNDPEFKNLEDFVDEFKHLRRLVYLQAAYLEALRGFSLSNHAALTNQDAEDIATHLDERTRELYDQQISRLARADPGRAGDIDCRDALPDGDQLAWYLIEKDSPPSGPS